MKLVHLAVLVAAIAASAPALQGCAGGGARTSVETTTTGQQLSDLKKAFDEGVISKSEYERKRREILRH